METDAYLGAVQPCRQRTGSDAVLLGTQRGAKCSTPAIGAVAGFCVSPGGHYATAVQVPVGGKDHCAARLVPGIDLRFAAEQTVTHAGHIRGFRRRVGGLIKELSNRTTGISIAVRAKQKGNIRKAAWELFLGLVVACCIFMCWPGWGMPQRFVAGFQVTNVFEEADIWKFVGNPGPCTEH